MQFLSVCLIFSVRKLSHPSPRSDCFRGQKAAPDVSTLGSYWCWAQQEAAFGILEVLHCTWLPRNLSGCLGLNVSPLPAKELGLQCHQFFQLGRSLV